MLSFLMLFPAKIFLFWQVVAFQNIEIILDMVQSCELRFQFFQGSIIAFFLRLQGIVFSRKLLQCRHLSINRGIESLRFFVCFDIFSMLIVEFWRPAGSFILRVNIFRSTVIANCLPQFVDLFHSVLPLTNGGMKRVSLRAQHVNLIFQFLDRSDVMLV